MFVVAVVVLLPLAPLLWWRVNLANDVRQALAEREAAGLPVSRAALNERLPDLSLENNRATRYYEAQQGLHAFSPEMSANLPFYSETALPGPAEPLSAPVLDAMEKVVQENGEALQLLHGATALPAGSYIARYGVDGSEESLSHLPVFTRLVRLLCYDSLVGLERGDSGRAYDALHAAVALTSSLEHTGYATNLRLQWEMEKDVIAALERVLRAPPVSDDILAPFQAQFHPEHRKTVYRHVLETEQALFVARIREGRKRSLLQGLVVAAGVGDMNIRSYLAAGELLLSWPDAAFDRRNALERAYGAIERTWEESPLLYATALYFAPPAPTARIKAELDRAAAVSVALAAMRYHGALGQPPTSVAELVPAYLDAVPQSAATGEPVVLITNDDEVNIAAGSVKFRLPI